MKLEELLVLLGDNTQVKVFDRNNDYVTKCDGKDSIPVCLNGTKVNSVRAVGNELFVYLDFCDNTKAIEYLKARLDDIVETIATNEYDYNTTAVIDDRITSSLNNIINDIDKIMYNIDRHVEWNDGMYI